MLLVDIGKLGDGRNEVGTRPELLGTEERVDGIAQWAPVLHAVGCAELLWRQPTGLLPRFVL